MPPVHKQAVFWIGLIRDLVLAFGAIAAAKLPWWVAAGCGVAVVGLRYAYAWYSRGGDPGEPPGVATRRPPPGLETPRPDSPR